MIDEPFWSLYSRVNPIVQHRVIRLYPSQKEILPPGSEKTITAIILNVTLPALILFGMDVPFSFDNIKQFVWLSMMSAFVLIVSSIVSWWTVKKLNTETKQKMP